MRDLPTDYYKQVKGVMAHTRLFAHRTATADRKITRKTELSGDFERYSLIAKR